MVTALSCSVYYIAFHKLHTSDLNVFDFNLQHCSTCLLNETSKKILPEESTACQVAETPPVYYLHLHRTIPDEPYCDPVTYITQLHETGMVDAKFKMRDVSILKLF